MRLGSCQAEAQLLLKTCFETMNQSQSHVAIEFARHGPRFHFYLSGSLLLLAPLSRYGSIGSFYIFISSSQLSIIETIERSRPVCYLLLLLPSIRRGNRGLTMPDEYLVSLSRLACAFAKGHAGFADGSI